MTGFRLILCIALFIFAGPVHAADGVLPISVRLISCGPTVAKACQIDSRCCGLARGDIELAEYEVSQQLNLIQSFAGDGDVYHDLDLIEQERIDLLQ